MPSVCSRVTSGLQRRQLVWRRRVAHKSEQLAQLLIGVPSAERSSAAQRTQQVPASHRCPLLVSTLQAPEVLLGSPASSKSDSFSMGVILWEASEERVCCVGMRSRKQRPIQAAQPHRTRSLHVEGLMDRHCLLFTSLRSTAADDMGHSLERSGARTCHRPENERRAPEHPAAWEPGVAAQHRQGPRRLPASGGTVYSADSAGGLVVCLQYVVRDC